MIRRLYARLPGPPWLRVAVLVVAGIALLVLLVLLYEWIGSTLLDSGGSIG